MNGFAAATSAATESAVPFPPRGTRDPAKSRHTAAGACRGARRPTPPPRGRGVARPHVAPRGGPPHAREERMGKRSLAYPAGPVHDERGRGTAEPLVQGADLRVPPEQLPPGGGGGRRPPGGPGPLVAAPPA